MLFSLSQFALPKHAIKSTLAYKRLFLPIALLCLIFNESTRAVVLGALADAFLQVTMFVAATLYGYYLLVNRFPKLELSYIAQVAPKLEIPFAALLGALPGCGGAIIVVTQYTKKQASFGSLVAVLIATMGDAAFLLIAAEPKTALLVLTISFTVATLFGWLVNLLHPADFLAPNTPSHQQLQCQKLPKPVGFISLQFWRIVALPMTLAALLVAFQYDFGENINQGLGYIAAACCFIVALLWACSSPGKSYQDVTAEDDCSKESLTTKVLQDTHFITSWVVAAFIGYELFVLWSDVNIAALFQNYAVLLPLIACLIGLLPGCGPQILVTSLYMQGLVPFSALMANAISNDGDALFPAIALAPKAALIATLYTSIPSLAIGYFIFFF
ncbi:MAG: putative manganese transporter [Pseudoalteromonas spongiae]